MNYCEGYYEPNTTVTREQHPSENVTYCSNRTAFFHFDPTAIIQSELAPGVNLTDIHWPSEIEDAVRAVEVASKVMFIFYCIGIGFVGLALIGAAWGVLANGRISAFVNFMLDIVSPLISKPLGKMTRHTLPTTVRRRAGESNPMLCLLLPHLHTANTRQLAFLTLVIASIISTVIITKAVNAVNKYGADIGIAAYKGSTFLGMTWAATALMLLASVVWIAECCRGRKNRAYTEKGAY
jgi:hypothetical protein